jgi:hypothetical protein
LEIATANRDIAEEISDAFDETLRFVYTALAPNWVKETW